MRVSGTAPSRPNTLLGSMPSFFIRVMNVVRLSPRRLAAPFGPPTTAIGFFESLDDFIAINFGEDTPYRPAFGVPVHPVCSGALDFGFMTLFDYE